jgi:hypothetical protein
VDSVRTLQLGFKFVLSITHWINHLPVLESNCSTAHDNFDKWKSDSSRPLKFIHNPHHYVLCLKSNFAITLGWLFWNFHATKFATWMTTGRMDALLANSLLQSAYLACIATWCVPNTSWKVRDLTWCLPKFILQGVLRGRKSAVLTWYLRLLLWCRRCQIPSQTADFPRGEEYCVSDLISDSGPWGCSSSTHDNWISHSLTLIQSVHGVVWAPLLWGAQRCKIT